MKNLVLMLVAAAFGYGVCWVQHLSPRPGNFQPAGSSPAASTPAAPPTRVTNPADDKLTREIGKPLVTAKSGSGYSFWIYQHRVVFVSSSGAMIGSTSLDPTNVSGQSYFSAPENPSNAKSPRKEYLFIRNPEGGYQIQELPSSAGNIDRGRFGSPPKTAPGASGLRGGALDQRPGR